MRHVRTNEANSGRFHNPVERNECWIVRRKKKSGEEKMKSGLSRKIKADQDEIKDVQDEMKIGKNVDYGEQNCHSRRKNLESRN